MGTSNAVNHAIRAKSRRRRSTGSTPCVSGEMRPALKQPPPELRHYPWETHQGPDPTAGRPHRSAAGGLRRLDSCRSSCAPMIRHVSASSPPDPAWPATAAHFIGGMNVPGASGRVNATWPLAELTARDGELVLRPRAFAAWLFTDFAVPVSQVVHANPLSGTVMTPGVGLALSDGEVAYFWTRRPDEVLTWLAHIGVRVDPQPQRASAVWRWWRRGSTAATRTPRLTRPLKVLYPLLALVSVPVLVWLLDGSPGPGFTTFVVAVWAAGLVTGTRLWWLSR
jgi:hypothetical protein